MARKVLIITDLGGRLYMRMIRHFSYIDLKYERLSC